MLGETTGTALGAGGFLGVLAVIWTVLVYNGFVSVRERVEMSESMLDVQLRRRAVLLPRLQACVGDGFTALEAIAIAVGVHASQGQLNALQHVVGLLLVGNGHLLLLNRIDPRDSTDRLLIECYRFSRRVGVVQLLGKFALLGD